MIGHLSILAAIGRGYGPWAQGCGASISAAAQRVTLPIALGTPLAIQRSQAALRRLSRVKQKDIAMHSSIAAVVERPLTRRLLMVTAGLAFCLAGTPFPKAPNTSQGGRFHSLSGPEAMTPTTVEYLMLLPIREANKKVGHA